MNKQAHFKKRKPCKSGSLVPIAKYGNSLIYESLKNFQALQQSQARSPLTKSP